MIASAVARIRSAALLSNLERVRNAAPGARILAVIKANAYGHGLEDVAQVLGAADAFAVARIDAAIRLRLAGIDKPIVILGGWFDRDGVELARKYDLQLVVHSVSQVELLAGLDGGAPVSVWLKIDSGMGRLGLAPAQADVAIERLRDCPAVIGDPVLMTHLARADETDHPATSEQLRVFGETIGDWGGDVSIANSAGILAWPETLKTGPHLKYAGDNWVRPGLMLYGVSPFADRSPEELGLVPVMTFEARLIAVRDIEAGDRVGYGGDWLAARDSRIGVIDAGYADGYSWRIPSGAPVRVGGTVVPVVGRISMDMISVDLTDAPDATVGDRVVLWGDEPGVADLAARAGTAVYELLTGVGNRVQRRME
jgi:alanine racemase